MNFLLDTCTFLWLTLGNPSISHHLRSLLVNSNKVYLSVVSTWEIITKISLKKFFLPSEPGPYIKTARTRHKIEPLSLDEESVASHLFKLPPLHKDPFDRMLICQALEHGLTIVTPDEAIRVYPVKTLWE